MMSVKRLGFYCLFMLLCFTARLHGQIRCKLEHYSTEDGLSHDGVMSMIKDHEGFMWFGTWDGINRFDGHTFITYKARPGDTSSLKNNRIDNIVEDKSGYLWIKAYNNQIYRFDKKTEQFLALSSLFKDPKLKNTVFDRITTVSNGDIWLTSADQGVFYVRRSASAQPVITQYAQNLNDARYIPSNHFNFLFEDKDTHVWIGTPEGLCYFEQDNSGNYQPKKLDTQYAGHFNFTSVAEGAGKMWFGTAQGTILTFSKNKRQFTTRQITQHKINGVFISRDKKRAYASTSASQLLSINITNKSLTTYAMPGAEAFYTLHEDKSGIIWIEPAKHGIIRFKPADKTFKYFFQKNDATFYNPAKAYSVFEDYTGTVWVRMKGGGFGYYNPVTDNVDYFHDQPGSPDRLFSNIVTCKYMDTSGILWLSSNDRGINKIIFQRNDFNQKLVVEHSINKSDNDIRAIYNDRKNRLWMASKSGKLYVYQNDKQLVKVFENEPSEGLGVIYTILQDKSGNIWIGTKGNGLFKASPTNISQSKYKLTHFTSITGDQNSLSSNVIYSLYEDNAGRIWVGTYEQGLNVITNNNGETRFLNNKNAFKNYPKDTFNKIRHLQQDATGNLWVATTDGLLIMDVAHNNLKNCSITTYHKNPGDKVSLGNNNIQYIYRDSHNTMWLATSGGGLNKAIGNNPLKALTFKVFTTADGLPNDYILSCAEDSKGNLWLATEKGLSEFDPANNRFRNFDSYDGLPTKAGFSEASNVKLPDGKLIFGSTNGYISFYPDKIVNHRTEAKMAFTNLQVNNEDVKVNGKDSLLKFNINNTQNLVLQHNQNIVSIDYALLDFRSGNKQTYAYRLKGFDTVWHNNQNQRRATYTNLPPGNYKFEVKSLSNDLYLAIPQKSLAITILPPPWKTWWAYTLYIVFTIAIIETVRRIALTMLRLRHRISVEQKLGEMKLSFFTNISHELRTPLTLILNPIEEIFLKEKLSVQGNAYINVVRKNANRMVRFINQLLDLRKLQSGKSTLKIAHIELISFLHKINEYFVDVAREKEITVTITSPVKKLYAWIDADKIDIVIYNLLANAFKFSPKGKNVNIEIKPVDDSLFTIAVIDEGFGVAPEQIGNIFKLYYEADHTESNLKGTGIGLALSKELVQLHHGTIRAKNNPDNGLTVTVELKTGKEHFKIDEVSFVDAPVETNEIEHEIPDDEIQSLMVEGLSKSSNLPLILLVEDNTDLRNFLVIQLSELYQVEEATNGEDGLEKAIRLLPDLVLSDVMMPKMDGIQMLDQLKNNLKTSHIPVILLSAKFSVENQIEGLKYGADYYITKPFQNNFLLASIENLLKQRKKIFEAMLPDTKTIALKPGEIVITNKDESFLKEIIQIVESGMSDPDFNIDTVAESIGMGRTTFYKKFKSLTNQPPVEFVRDMRLIRSKQMFDAGQHSVSEVGYAVGFNSVGYFGKCFKEKYDISPSEYLKTHNLEKPLKV